MTRTRRLLPTLGLCILGAACSPSPPSDANTFLLRGDEPDTVQACREVLDALVSSLRAEESLQWPHPLVGHLATEPDPSQEDVQIMRCAEGEPDDLQEGACILLNRGGDFVRLLPVTWQSEAFYTYTIYVLPRSIFATLDPTRDFIAIDVYLMQETGLWEAVDQAIRVAAADAGARPFRP